MVLVKQKSVDCVWAAVQFKTAQKYLLSEPATAGREWEAALTDGEARAALRLHFQDKNACCLSVAQ